MRALYLDDLIAQDVYEISGDPLHHLVNVVRLENDEELLLLNGSGFSVKTKVLEIGKKRLLLQKTEENITERKFVYDLALGIPKKDALELSLKQAVELGFRKIFLVRSDYSQTRLPEETRIRALLISALEQSNSTFLPEIEEADWNRVPWNDYGTVLVLDSQKGKDPFLPRQLTPALLVVGPEGGFSPAESSYFQGLKGIESLLLPTPIMRTPTAVATGAGVLLQRLMS